MSLIQPAAQPKPIFLPMPGRVVVKLDERDRIGSLFLPSQSKESRVLGTILAIGEDQEDGDFYDLKVGDYVMFGQHSGFRVSIGQDKALILGTREILCRVEWEDGEGRRYVADEDLLGDPSHVPDLPVDESQAEIINLREPA